MISQEQSAVARPPSNADDARIAQVMEEYLAAQEAGKRPRVEDFLARYPEMSPALARALEGLDFIHQAANQMQNSVPGCVSAKGHAASSDVGVGRALGDFRIV